MAFRRKGTETERPEPCWCGAKVIVTTGLDTNDEPYSFESCTRDIFHDPSTRKDEP